MIWKVSCPTSELPVVWLPLVTLQVVKQLLYVIESNLIKETTAKTYEDSDYIVVIAVVYWLKVIVQKLLSGAVLSPFVFVHSCDITYVAMRALGHNSDADKRYTVCERARCWFSPRKLQIQPVIDLCKSPVTEPASVSWMYPLH